MSSLLPPIAALPALGRPLFALAPAWWVGIGVATLVLSPVFTDLAALFLVVLLLAGLWAAWRLPAIEPVDPLLRQWLGLGLAVFLLRGAATALWSDSWGARHFELRLLISALALWLLLPRTALSPVHQIWLRRGLAAACWTALAVTWLHGRDTPTNPIPWAAGVGFLVCVLLAHSAELRRSPLEQAVCLLSAFAGVVSVVLSQSRGSWGLLIWFALVLVWLACRAARHKTDRFALRWSLLGMVGLVVLLVGLQPRHHQASVSRAHDAAQQLTGAAQAMHSGRFEPALLGTSVGVRLFLYQQGWDHIKQAPVVGHGAVHRREWVQSLGQLSGSESASALQHLHSDPLNIWLEHGLLGLTSYLLLVLGLCWLAWRSKARGAGMGLGLAGLAWMHGSSGLTNVNTLHNYYGVMLSLAVSLLFLLNSQRTQARPTARP